METSLLLDGVATGTDFWNDSCAPDDLRYAMDHGATGATSNPPIVLGIVRAEGPVWRDRARQLYAEHPTWTEAAIAWSVYEEVATRGAMILEPFWTRTGGLVGRLSAQVNPALYRDAESMVRQAERLASLAPNMQVKLPVTTAGLIAIEEAVYRGIEVNATANFTVAGAIAVGEAVERALKRRAAEGKSTDFHHVCTLMVGRLDDWVKAACDRDEVLLTPGRAEWAGVAVFKRAYAIYAQRGFRARLLAGAFRHHLAWSQLLGADAIITIPPAWQHWLNASGLKVASRIGEPVDAAIIDELLERAPEFRLAYEPEGLAPGELDSYGASLRTMRQFLAAWFDLQSEVRDAVLPNPDLKPARA